MIFSHIPVFLHEAVDALNIRPGGVYVDCTAGGGGHSAAIADVLSPPGRLISVDRDPDAIEVLTSRFAGDERVTVVHDNYVNIKCILSSLGLGRADGILADLGVSSHQLDDASRGFSFHADAPLDMRMSREGRTAAELVNTAPEAEIRRILYEYGEEKFAPSIARGIVRAREVSPIETTLQLAEIVKANVPAAVRRENGHPARRTFQALRIEINGELSGLTGALEAMFDSLNPGGRLAVITFHSLEDRAVKQYFASLLKGCTCPPDFPVCVCGKSPRGALPFKVIKPSSEQIEENPRSRSAALRAIEKIR